VSDLSSLIFLILLPCYPFRVLLSSISLSFFCYSFSLSCKVHLNAKSAVFKLLYTKYSLEMFHRLIPLMFSFSFFSVVSEILIFFPTLFSPRHTKTLSSYST